MFPYRRRRDTEDSEESEDYSIEEMKMMHDYADEEGDDDEDEHEMSVVDDHGNSNKTNEWHIDIFGELAHNEPEAESVTVEPKNASTTATAKEAKEARELLFHPANFKKDDQSVSFPVDDMKSEHFNDMMFSIQNVYKRIGNVQLQNFQVEKNSVKLEKKMLTYFKNPNSVKSEKIAFFEKAKFHKIKKKCDFYFSIFSIIFEKVKCNEIDFFFIKKRKKS